VNAKQTFGGSPGFGVLLLSLMMPTALSAQQPESNSPPIEVIKLHYEKQARLPRNFDPSVIPTGPGFNDQSARTSSTAPTNAQDATRAATSAQSSATLRTDTEFPATPRRMPTLYVYSMRIRNTAMKTIEGVSWEYIFSDPVSGIELGRHQFRSYEKVAANKGANLQNELRSPPTRIVNASNSKNLKPLETSVIQCILYSDNTTWRNPAAALDACTKLMTGRGPQKQRRNRPA
jgi:hypothetical protein